MLYKLMNCSLYVCKHQSVICQLFRHIRLQGDNYFLKDADANEVGIIVILKIIILLPFLKQKYNVLIEVGIGMRKQRGNYICTRTGKQYCISDEALCIYSK